MVTGAVLKIFIFITLSYTVLGNIVMTPSGRIKGNIEVFDGIPVKTFLGIPFVKAPVGELRFKRPVPIEPWNHVLEATQLPPGCIQYLNDALPTYDNFTGTSEDCLYLNIWVPAPSSKFAKKAVMFWVHGGDFIISSSRLDFFYGTALAARGDVIVVTTNYRLGPFGFAYSGTDDAPGNMGMWDIIEALKWVRANIESFGGDKDAITIFGQSAGGIAIAMLCTSPVATDLFQRAIMQSGSPASMAGEDNDKDYRVTKLIAEAVSCSDEYTTLDSEPQTVVECLRGVSADILAETLMTVTANISLSVYPRYGDELIPESPRLAIINGQFNPVELLIGNLNGEGSSVITQSMQDVFGLFGEKDPQINRTFGEYIIRRRFKDYPDPEKVVEYYLGELAEDDYDRIRFQVFTATGDYTRTCPINFLAESFAKKNVRVFHYYFTHRPVFNTPWAPWMLAVHFDEVPFVFGYPLRYPDYYTPAEQMLSQRMISAWSSFAKHGVPEEMWPLYSKENPQYQTLDIDTSTTGYGPHQENCEFFRPYFGFSLEC